MFTEYDVVFRYTRDDAVQDGVLVDLPHAAKQAGFTIPLALTAGVFSECVYSPETEPAIQDETGRQWDVLYTAETAARRAAVLALQGATAFDMVIVPRGGHSLMAIQLVLHVCLGDAGEPVATVMFPDED